MLSRKIPVTTLMENCFGLRPLEAWKGRTDYMLVFEQERQIADLSHYHRDLRWSRLAHFGFIPATHIGTYWSFLLGLFILAAGLTCWKPWPILHHRSRPEGIQRRAHQSRPKRQWRRLDDWSGARWFFVLSATSEANTSNADLYKPLFDHCHCGDAAHVVFVFAKVPDLKAEEECKVEGGPSKIAVKPLFKRWHFILAVAAQFFLRRSSNRHLQLFYQLHGHRHPDPWPKFGQQTANCHRRIAAANQGQHDLSGGHVFGGRHHEHIGFRSQAAERPGRKDPSGFTIHLEPVSTNQSFLAAPSIITLVSQIRCACIC